MPAGWKGIEKLYGPTSKCAGKVYTRYYSLDGKIKHVCSPKQVITIDCEAKGQDPAPAIAEYVRLQKERQQREQEERQIEREAKGKLGKEAREDAINRFRGRFGELKGPMVFRFPGWLTRWHYQPNCDQVMIEYIDTEGNSWKLLKDLECFFQHKIDTGDAADKKRITELLETAQAKADPAEFAKGSKGAREIQGSFELQADSLESRTFDRDEREAISRKRQEQRKESSEHYQKKRRNRMYLSLSKEGPKQTGWAALGSQEDARQALSNFRGLLMKRGFKDDLELLAVYGVSPERTYAKRLCGVYYAMGAELAEQRCYQKLLHLPQVLSEVACDGIYIVWSASCARWEITTKPEDGAPAIAHSSATAGRLAKDVGPWQVQDGQGDFTEDAGLVILQPE